MKKLLMIGMLLACSFGYLMLHYVAFAGDTAASQTVQDLERDAKIK